MVSIAVVVVQFGAGQYTPRLVSRFRRDPIVKHALGAFIAPAIFSLVSLGGIGRNGATVVPSVAITVALALGAVLAFYRRRIVAAPARRGARGRSRAARQRPDGLPHSGGLDMART